MAAKAVYRGLRNHKGTVYIKINFHFFSSYLMFKGSRIPFLTYLMSFKVIFKVKFIKMTKKCQFFTFKMTISWLQRHGNYLLTYLLAIFASLTIYHVSRVEDPLSDIRFQFQGHIQGRMVKQWRKWDFFFVKLSYLTTCMWDG